MARPPKLSPEQRAEVVRRLAEGEGVRALAREFGVDPSVISRLGVAQQTQQVRVVAQQVAAAQTALAALPVAQQYTALTLADKLRNISCSLASAAELGAATAHRLSALANTEVAKIDDASVLSDASMGAMRGVAALTKLANDSSSIALNLLAANKEAINKANQQAAEKPVTGVVFLDDDE
jgi:transposase-like protein